MVLLVNYAPMLRYNLANDDFGNIVIVSGESWAAAYYFIHGR